MLRRNRTNRIVKLTAGNLVLDCAIPTRLAGFLPRKDEDEFGFTRCVEWVLDTSEDDTNLGLLGRYTAVTCGVRPSSTPTR